MCRSALAFDVGVETQVPMSAGICTKRLSHPIAIPKMAPKPSQLDLRSRSGIGLVRGGTGPTRRAGKIRMRLRLRLIIRPTEGCAIVRFGCLKEHLSESPEH